jgi:hypothetical protein
MKWLISSFLSDFTLIAPDHPKFESVMSFFLSESLFVIVDGTAKKGYYEYDQTHRDLDGGGQPG